MNDITFNTPPDTSNTDYTYYPGTPSLAPSRRYKKFCYWEIWTDQYGWQAVWDEEFDN